jgi:hypothetical protein
MVPQSTVLLPMPFTPATNLLAVSLTPVNSFSLTPVKNFKGYYNISDEYQQHWGKML